jgi:long-chain-alcohol oxidase
VRLQAQGVVQPSADVRVQRISSPTLSADVIIVGSGAGGSVAAAILANAGLKVRARAHGCRRADKCSSGVQVIVLEKGIDVPNDRLTGHELATYETMFERQGVLANRDSSMVVLAAATVGGGPRINWCASFRPPRHVLDEWVRDFGLGFCVPGGELEEAYRVVAGRVNINIDNSHRGDGFGHCSDKLVVNAQNEALARGCQALGWEVRPIPRNVKDCHDCGSCCFGCTRGSKQDVRSTWLLDAVKAGAVVYESVWVDKVLVEDGRAMGVVGTALASDGATKIAFTATAPIVISSAGATKGRGVEE